MSSCPPKGEYYPFTERFELLGAPYMVTGSIAAMVYSEPRFTNDIDVVVRLDMLSARRLVQLFPADEFYCPPFDVILTELARDRRGHFNLLQIETGFKADIYIQGNDPLHAWALEHARRLKVGDSTISVAPVEYVILRKLEYYREGGSEKHLRDIAAILRISGEKLNVEKFEEFVQERDLEAEWNKARS